MNLGLSLGEVSRATIMKESYELFLVVKKDFINLNVWWKRKKTSNTNSLLKSN